MPEPAPAPGALPLGVPAFPPGVDPETHRREEVTALLRRAAYFSLFSVPNPDSPNRPIEAPPLLPFLPALPFLWSAVEVHEQPHRFEMRMEAGCGPGLAAANLVGRPVSTVDIRWTPIPDGFQASPDRPPPPRILNPFVSQRFEMLDGRFRFMDRDGSGFHGFGTGRTFPVFAPGARELHIGAVIDIIEGFGRLAGKRGTVVVNGTIRPPRELALSLMVRIMDPEGELLAGGPLPPLGPDGDPDPTATFMTFLGEPDPERPVELIQAPDGRILGSKVFERLRLVDLESDIAPGRGLAARTVEGAVVGSVVATLHFNPLDPLPVSPIQTTDGVFNFHRPDGGPLGTVRSNMVEGRALRTPLSGAPMPVFRFGGFGPILGGSGEFAGARGMMSMNSAVSVFPRTLSNLYILRFVDPEGRLRARLR